MTEDELDHIFSPSQLTQPLKSRRDLACQGNANKNVAQLQQSQTIELSRVFKVEWDSVGIRLKARKNAKQAP